MSDITPFPAIQEVALPGDPAGSDGTASPTPDGSRKLKGRERLLRRLSRISSSPTLAQLGRARSSSSPYRTQSSLSCVSLAQAGPSPLAGQQGQPCYFSQNPKGFMTSAPTSTPTTPGLDTPFFDTSDAHFAVRKIDLSQPPTGTTTPMSASPTLVYRSKQSIFNLFDQMPNEVKVEIFSYFSPKELVRLSRVNKEFYKICFDGQLWKSLDASEFYQQIPADSLAKIIVGAGPFVKDLNLRGCVHLEHYKRAEAVVKACENLMTANLEGCRNFERNTLLSLVKRNNQLTNLNLTGLVSVTNSVCKAIAQNCPQVEVVNVSWCKRMDAAGIKTMVEGLPKLRDLRACEIMGFDSLGLCELLFRTNNLERLVLSGCTDVNDAALRTMLYGRDPEIDILTDRPVVPPRKLRHLDLTRCSRLTSNGVKALGHFVPDLEGLQLGGCTALTDAALEPILATTPRLTHLNLEELADLTNNILAEHLAKAPCAPNLEYLSISYCENLGDVGMLPVMRACKGLRSVDMDNTRVSDLVLAEAAAMVRARSGRTQDPKVRPSIGLSMVVYDCQNVTWTGAKEILHRNAEMIPVARQRPASADEAVAPGVAPQVTGMFATEIIGLKCYYGWQMTVDEHTKRVLKADRASAVRLERKWADYMQATEELGAGAGRRRRRRARETAAVHADEEEGPAGRRRARTTACIVM